jgi:hypothetical protein
MKKSSERNKNKKSEKDPMIEHLKQEIERDMSYIELTKERLADLNARIAQNRKILKKLKG